MAKYIRDGENIICLDGLRYVSKEENSIRCNLELYFRYIDGKEITIYFKNHESRDKMFNEVSEYLLGMISDSTKPFIPSDIAKKES